MAASLEARLFPPHALPKVGRDQHRKLEERFLECRNPNDSDIMIIAAEVGLSEHETKIWFKHRLALWRRQQGLPANSSAVYDP